MSINASVSNGSESSSVAVVDPREFRILIASDVHLGYQDRSSERRLDSLNTFEEVLKIGVEKEAHFVLLAGDLFHVNDPPKWVVKEAMRLLRRYCLGDRDIDFRLTSDQSRNFSDSDVPIVNYEDPNINVSLPVFTIHGNHDDPVGVQHESVVKMLSTAGLLNYFGRVSDLSSVELEPLLFERARTKVAVYGLGSVQDERLNTLFREGRVQFRWPANSERWFKILLLHQNRVKRGPGNYLPESFLPSELDLVIWGHEHECLIRQHFNGQYHVIQPGSTVATSLCVGEVADKHAGILRVQYNKADKMQKFDLEPVRLLTVRQLFVEEIPLSEMPSGPGTKLDRTVQYLQDKIEDIVERAVGLRTGHPKQPLKPLVRLRVYFGPDHETFLPHLVGRHFKGKIANPEDCLRFIRDQELWTRERRGGQLDEEKFMDAVEEQKKTHAKIENMINAYFKSTTDENTRLHVIHPDAFTKAVQFSVEKENAKDIIHNLVESSKRRMHDRLLTAEDAVDEVSMMQYIVEHKPENNNDVDPDVQSIIKKLESIPGSVKTESHADEVDADGMSLPMSSTGRGRGRGRGRGARGAAAAVRVKEEQVSVIESSSDEDGSSSTKKSGTVKGRGRGRGKAGAGIASRSAASRKKDVTIIESDNDSDDDEFDQFVDSTVGRISGDKGRSQTTKASTRGRQATLNSFVAPTSSKRAAKRGPVSSSDEDDVGSVSMISSSLQPSAASRVLSQSRSQQEPAAKKTKKQAPVDLFDGFD
ncbi:double-strand break repair protein MRE11-like [Tropilaelaps mercedesae]|uniref:Double-strand break repair protein n=1 Tax=Tropilaelaps mercedesae TaxID=418985 RepID=A0A1V9X695_9ACAR|nr:double-strand break repair protein MRE11-like [Tropilaelaps mercedesae]